MSALGFKFTILHNVDLVYIYDGGETMGAVDHSFASHDILKLCHNLLLSVGV